MRNIDTTNAKKRNLELGKERQIKYYQHPKLCKECLKPIIYKKHWQQDFCSHKCAGIYCNRVRYGIKIRHNCHRCGKELSQRTQGKYCGNCHIIARTEKMIGAGIPMTSHRLRSYLLSIRGYKCERCGLEMWLGEPIPIDTHHIDGKWENNNLNNLELLCKNCHGLTNTYGSKNMGNGRPFGKRPKQINIIVTK